MSPRSAANTGQSGYRAVEIAHGVLWVPIARSSLQATRSNGGLVLVDASAKGAGVRIVGRVKPNASELLRPQLGHLADDLDETANAHSRVVFAYQPSMLASRSTTTANPIPSEWGALATVIAAASLALGIFYHLLGKSSQEQQRLLA